VGHAIGGSGDKHLVSVCAAPHPPSTTLPLPAPSLRRYGGRVQNPRVGMFTKSWVGRHTACDFTRFQLRSTHGSARSQRWYAPAGATSAVVQLPRYAMYRVAVQAVGTDGRRSAEAASLSPVFSLTSPDTVPYTWSASLTSMRMHFDATATAVAKNLDLAPDLTGTGNSGVQAREWQRAQLMGYQSFDRSSGYTYANRFWEYATGSGAYVHEFKMPTPCDQLPPWPLRPPTVSCRPL